MYKFLACVLVVGMLFSTACTPSTNPLGNLENDLNYIVLGVDTAEAVVPLLEAEGTINPILGNEILVGLQSGAACASAASKDLASTDTNAVKYTKIVGDCAEAAKNAAPTGSPAEVIAVVQLVDKAILTFLGEAGQLNNQAIKVGVINKAFAVGLHDKIVLHQIGTSATKVSKKIEGHKKVKK